MGDVQLELIQMAIDKHKRIFPCGNAAVLGECFTTTEDRVLFWYNTEDDSTHLLEQTLVCVDN
jgi:hypothetical protein